MTENTPPSGMTPNRPYLLRAIYDWISDNGLTPYVLVDATQAGVDVPQQSIKDGQIVLNLAVQAVKNLDLGDDRISFSARFGGVSRQIVVPMQALLAIYAQENGQGMMFPVEEDNGPPPDGTSADDTAPADDKKPERRSGAHLRVVK